MSAAGISGASRKAGFGEGNPQQVSREGQNRRIADFGTVVETCSVTAADCPCLVLPYIERTGQGLRPAVGGLFSFPLKILLKGYQLPAGRGFFKISLCPLPRTIIKNAKRRGKNFSLTYYYNPNRAKWPEMEPGNKKSSKSFSDLLLSLAAGGG